MASPFKIFRKYQKVMLGVLAVLAMILFGVGDQLIKMARTGASTSGDVIVDSKIGKLTQRDFQILAINRQQANRFMSSAILAAFPQYAKNPGMLQIFVPDVGHVFGGFDERELVFSWIMRHEARQMGVVVTQKQIEDFITQRTFGKLTTRQFNKILADQGISGKQLYDILRSELEARMAQLKLPTSPDSPEQYWKIYQQLHTRQKIAAVPLRVRDFTEKIADPSDAEISKFFEEYKDQRPDRSTGGEFVSGFRQPAKVRLQYLELSYNEVEERVARENPVTDEQIEEYYEKKKDVDRDLQEKPLPPVDESSPINPDFAPEPGAEGAGPSLGTQAEPKPEPPSLPEGDSPSGGSCEPGRNVADDDDAETSKTEDAGDEPAAPPSKDDPSDGKDDPDADQESPLIPSLGKKPFEEGDDQDVDFESPPKIKPAPPKPRYKPLDGLLRGTIRDKLLHQRTLDAMKQTIGQAHETMTKAGIDLGTQHRLSELKPEVLRKLSRTALEKVASEFKLEFKETDLLSAEELSKLPGLGSAHEMGDADSRMGGAQNVVEQSFTAALCRVFRVQNSDMYLYWKVQDVPEHVPTLDEPGIREQVVEAWKHKEAIPLAKKRAEELAEIVRQADKPIEEALAGQTANGDPKGPAVRVDESPDFTWFTESTAPAAFSRPVVHLGNPVVVTDAGEDFMQFLFEKLSVDEVGVSFNDDASVAYVVKILSRRPANLETFKDAPLFGGREAYVTLARRASERLQVEYYRELERKYAIKWLEPSRQVARMSMADVDE